jgi:type II secretion system (T2SS) protein E
VARLLGPSSPFPILIDDGPELWQWPVPPYVWRHIPAPGNDVAQPCRVESAAGTAVDGLMLGFDPSAGTLAFRIAENAPVVTLPFSRFRRLTLTVPLQRAPTLAGAPMERVPAAAQEREYRIRFSGRAQALTGRTAGYVETARGLYLFTPVDEEASLQRVFVPLSADSSYEFGTSAEEVAATQWLSTPEALLEAIERQHRMPVGLLGESLLALGLLKRDQLNRVLATQSGDKPIGELLVAEGIISRADLNTALAHKMGYPLVDLARFPIDPAALAKLPHRIAAGYRVVPLLLDKDRLVVAVDKPSRAVRLNALHAYAQIKVVPVLASKTQMMLAFERLSHDLWSSYVMHRPAFFATST